MRAGTGTRSRCRSSRPSGSRAAARPPAEAGGRPWPARAARALLRRRRSPLARVVHEPPGQAEEDERDDERDREEQPRHRGAVGKLLEREERLVEVQVEEEGGAARLTGPVLEHERDEEVLEHLDHAED